MEITLSERLLNGKFKVYVEKKANAQDGDHNMTCYLPDYEFVNIYGFLKKKLINI